MEKIGLLLDVENKWDDAFKQAERAAAKAGATIDTTTKKATAFGSAISGAATKGVADFGKLTKQALDAEKAMAGLGLKTKAQGGLLDDLGKKIATAELITKGFGMALQIAGDYLKGAFDRAKIDPALAGINELRLATEGWTTQLEHDLDRVLNKAARGIQSLGRGFSNRGLEVALEERARPRAT